MHALSADIYMTLLFLIVVACILSKSSSAIMPYSCWTYRAINAVHETTFLNDNWVKTSCAFTNAPHLSYMPATDEDIPFKKPCFKNF